MTIKEILSHRFDKHEVYWDVVFEWEDILSQKLNAPICPLSYSEGGKGLKFFLWHKYTLIKKLAVRHRDEYSLYFVLNAMDPNPLYLKPKYIPVIIDFFVSPNEIKKFIDLYSKCDYVFITSRQAYDIVNQYDLPFRLVHFPITISDKLINTSTATSRKKYDLTLFGRQNKDKLLCSFVEKFAQSHPGFTYVRQDVEDMSEQKGYVYKNNEGEVVSQGLTRDDYLQLIKDSRIAIYSTPGIMGREDGNGYNQVTPKFLEYLSGYCHVILRYESNSDTDFFELPRFSSSVDSYEDFEARMLEFLNKDVDKPAYDRYIKKHLTSTLADIVNRL